MDFLLADLSNSRCKIIASSKQALAQLDTRQIIASSKIDHSNLTEAFQASGCPKDAPVILSSVVPEKTEVFREVFADRLIEVSPELDLGVGIDFPEPEQIGADRLANAVAASELYGAPAIVIDFGTAVTFDVISENPSYLGGAIAPGLDLMRNYFHEKTALLPKIDLVEPPSAIGKSTEQAMLSGAIIGYRGLVRELLSEINAEMPPTRAKTKVIATGGYAQLIADGLPQISEVNELLTLEGLRLIANRALS